MSGDRLGASWQALASWAATTTRCADHRARTDHRPRAPKRAAAADAAEAAARKVVAELLGVADGPLPELRDQLVTAAATSVADLAAFDRDREQLAARLARIEQLDAERAVADQLGHLLRADGFEAWLMEAALGELIDAGGERLRELSSGQFSLELIGRDVMVRDHANADELPRRPHAVGRRDVPRVAGAGTRPRRRDERAGRRGRADGWSRSSSTRASARSTRHARRRRRRDRGARLGRPHGRRRDAHPRARRADAGAARGDQGRRLVDASSGSTPDAVQRRDVGAGVRLVDRGRGPRRRDRAGRRDGRAAARRLGADPAGARDRPDRMLFVDGVRRIDARVWIADGDRVHAGVCASVAAGVVECAGGTAVVTEALVRRAVIAPAAAGGGDITTRHARYAHVPTIGDDPGAVYLAIHARMTALEHEVVGSDHGAELVVFDGPLRGRADPCGVGYVKTQHVQYVPDEAVGVLGRLGDGERTPLLLIGDRCLELVPPPPRAARPPAVGRRALRAAGDGLGRRGHRRGPTSCRRACPLRQRGAQGAAGAAEPGADRRARAAAAPPAR